MGRLMNVNTTVLSLAMLGIRTTQLNTSVHFVLQILVFLGPWRTGELELSGLFAESQKA